MAIHDDTTGQQPQPQLSINPGVVNNTGQAQAPQSSAPGIPWSFRSTEAYGSPISRLTGSEYTQAMTKRLQEILKPAQSAYDFEVIPIDRSTSNNALFFSVIVVALRTDDGGTTNIAYQPLILEKTNEQPGTFTKNINGAQVVITRLASDASDKYLEEIVGNNVRRFYGGLKSLEGKNAVSFWPIEPVVVPRDFDPTDDHTNVTGVAVNAATACGTELRLRIDKFNDINLRQMGQEPNLQILVNYGRQELRDVVGNPVRSDIREIFKISNPTRASDFSVNSPENSQVLAEVSSFVDLIWVGEETNVFNPYQPQRTDIRNYAARLVVTDIDNMRGYTPGSVLLALATVDAIYRDNNWLMAFRPQSADRNAVDLTDVGALGYENNFTADPAMYGKRVNTKAPDFDLKMLGSLISSLIKPGLVISLDVPEAGPQTWYTSIFSYGAKNKGNAARLIYNAANSLTDGAFGRHFNTTTGEQMFVDVDNKVHLGYYFNKGEKRDLRDIDYLAVANLVGEKAPERIREWSDTFTRVNIPWEIRLAERKNMIDEFTNGSAVYTGYAHRITFSAAFISALVIGCQEAGLMVTISTPLNAQDFNSARGVGNFVNNALLNPEGPSFISRAAAFGGYTGGQFGVFGGKW